MGDLASSEISQIDSNPPSGIGGLHRRAADLQPTDARLPASGQQQNVLARGDPAPPQRASHHRPVSGDAERPIDRKVEEAVVRHPGAALLRQGSDGLFRCFDAAPVRHRG